MPSFAPIYPGATGAAPTGALPTGASGSNFAPVQAGNFVQTVRLYWRVIHPVTGVVVADPLFHPHTSRFNVVYAQAGQSFESAIGDFEIPLHSPADEKTFGWYAAQYAQLTEWMRCEAYLVEEDSQGPKGNPVFTGVITKLPQDLRNFKIQGKDSLYLLSKKFTHRADVFQGRTDQLFRYALKGYQLTYGDDLTSGSLAGYNNNGGWTAVTDDGFSSLLAGTAGDGLLLSVTTFGNSPYADCEISAPFHCVGTTSITAAAEAGIVAAATDVNNLVLGRILMRYVNSTRWEVDLEIWQKSGGSYTRQIAVTGQIVSSTADYRPFLQLFGVQTDALHYTWRLVVDGQDFSCVWAQPVSSGSPTGSIGVRSTSGAVKLAGGTTNPATGSGLVFASKANVFQPGNVGFGQQPVNQAIPITKLTDLLQLAMNTEGWSVLKHPQAGLNNDILDFNQEPAGDVSSVVRFEEGDNVADAAQEPNADEPATGLWVAGNPGSSGSTVVKHYGIAAISKFGLIEDQVSDQTAVDALALRKHAHQALVRRVRPHRAKRLILRRHPRHNKHNALTREVLPTGLRWREGHYVRMHMPRSGINELRAQILGFAMIEGEETISDVLIDEYPQHLRLLPSIKKLKAEAIKGFFRNGDVTSRLLDGSGLQRDTRLILPVNPYKMRTWLNGAQGGLLDSGGPYLVRYDAVTGDPTVGAAGYDTANGFDTVNHQYKIPVSGFWQFNIVVSAAPPNNGAVNYQMILLLKRVGDVNYIAQSPTIWSNAAPPPSMGGVLPDLAFFSKGDILQVFVNLGSSGVGNWALSSGVGYQTFWSMQLISS